MQFNRYIALPKSSLFNHKLFFVFRMVLFVAIAYYLWQSLVANQKILLGLSALNITWQPFEVSLLLLTLILLPINWLLEGLKWRVIAADHHLNLKQSLKGVVLGVTLDNVMPVGTGSISGRVITLPEQKSRLKVIPGILVGQVMQSVVTFLFGLFGFWMVWTKAATLFHWQPIHSFSLIGLVLIAGLSLLFWRSKIVDFLKPLKLYPFKSWAIIFGFSLTRYLVFLVQFMLLSSIFAPEIDISLIFGCATWVFAARTFMPKISNIERLGIRALAVVFFMEIFSQPASGVLMAVVILWFINLAIPSIIGLTMFKEIKAGIQLK
jgi:hypothetical protein